MGRRPVPDVPSSRSASRWQAEPKGYGRAARSTATQPQKGLYLHQSSLAVNTGLGGTIGRTRLPNGRKATVLLGMFLEDG